MSYGPSISPLIYGSSPKRTGHKSEWGNKDPYLTVQCTTLLVTYLLYLHCVTCSGMISVREHTIVLNFWHTFQTRESKLEFALKVWGFVFSSAGHFLCWHLPLRRCDMFKIFKRPKRTLIFWENPSSLNELIWYVEIIAGFPWNVVRTFTGRWGTKGCRQILLF